MIRAACSEINSISASKSQNAHLQRQKIVREPQHSNEQNGNFREAEFEHDLPLSS